MTSSMGNKNNILPILEHPQWQKKESFNIPLYMVDKKGIEFPIISFFEKNNNVFTIIENLEDINLSGSELVRIAFKNLEETELNWVSKKLTNTPILSAEGTSASEKILDTAFLTEASELLESACILVAIPKQGLILATPYIPSDAHLDFSTYVASCFEDMTSIPLSDKLYIIENGKIKGIIRVKILDNNPINTSQDSVFVKVKKDISIKIVKRADASGFESFSITLGAEDFEDFANASYQIISDILNKNDHNPNFSGLIEFNILSEWLPKSTDFETIFSRFLERLKMQSNLATAANTLSKDIAITFIHLSDLESGNTHLKKRLKIFSTL
jgi:hypothetical protein